MYTDAKTAPNRIDPTLSANGIDCLGFCCCQQGPTLLQRVWHAICNAHASLAKLFSYLSYGTLLNITYIYLLFFIKNRFAKTRQREIATPQWIHHRRHLRSCSSTRHSRPLALWWRTRCRRVSLPWNTVAPAKGLPAVAPQNPQPTQAHAHTTTESPGSLIPPLGQAQHTITTRRPGRAQTLTHSTTPTHHQTQGTRN